MGLQVIMSADDSETCHTLHPRLGRKMSTSLIIQQTRSRFANSKVCKSGNTLLRKFVPKKWVGISKMHRKTRWMQCRNLFGQLIVLFIYMNAEMR
ncbi:hypothetical protein TNCV_1966111 [Trichonephila clavipes]|nr:hypothetical protein TNCV_1966111 [Trichonephila clavipes]